MRIAVVLQLVASTVAGPSEAATVPPPPDVKVRVVAPALGVRRAIGRLVAYGDTVLVARGRVGRGVDTLRLPATVITRLERSRGRSHRAGAVRGLRTGALVGLGVGIAAMPFLVASWDSDANCGCYAYERCGALTVPRAATYLVAPMIGAGVWGSAIGFAVGRERWEAIGAPRAGLAVGVAPALAREALGVRLTIARR